MTKLFILITSLLLTSCSLFQKDEYEFDKEIFEVPERDYTDQLASLTSSYLNTDGVTKINLNTRTKKYLEDLYFKIVTNNKLFLKEPMKPTFNIVKSEIPFIFALPKANFFFSSGLIIDYMKNEEIFIAAFAKEVIVSQRNLFAAKMLIPKGYIGTKDILAYTRLPVNIKAEVNKWAYYVLKRSGHDPYALLIWLQTMNKNTLDFTLQYGNTQIISREEFLFKSFISELKTKESFSGRQANSTPDYYHFVRDIKRKAR
ncbi:hypothetical protein BIY24_16035 [Halobacteriovorax marinus]|uniref:Membrane protein n=1 Tax=Halobacteriovorax marinus (strain ATCC BAA-682 / DSM 15412 / SJ) TaxID=862908 RepID=E1X164_HALMS|nr:hypothetical protein [Halobacteriovorax marinus]ATH09394.1 hypothetical protein BIY24_16035 [Halobacteriovorax marinus]CBW28134.1 putative membrane protein [Halobacteriovorax marinus SJ]